MALARSNVRGWMKRYWCVVKTAGHPGEKRGDRERQQFDTARADAHELAGDFVFADREHPPPILGMDEIADRPEGQDRDQTKIQGRLVRCAIPLKPRAPPTRVDILEDAFHDHGEGQGHDCQVIAARLKGKGGDPQPGQRRGPARRRRSPAEKSTARRRRGKAAP